MQDQRLLCAKVVAPPTPTTWSQAYNAGTLCAVVSLSYKEGEEVADLAFLGSIGKDILQNLEAEYFTIETKNLDAIKQAVTTVAHTIPPSVVGSLVVCAIVQNILYVCFYGNGQVLLKRGEKLGTIIRSEEIKEESGVNDHEVISLSGYLSDKDIVILETASFAKLIDTKTLDSFLQLEDPQDIAESLTPKLLATESKGASALILLYTESPKEPSEEKQEEEQQEVLPKKKRFSFSFPSFKLPEKLSALPRQKRMLLALAILLIVIFGISLFFFLNKKTAKNTSIQPILIQAQQKYNEAQGLSTLNKKLAISDLQSAETILTTIPSQATSQQENDQKEQLLVKIRQLQKDLSGETETAVKEVSSDKSPMLKALLTAKTTYGAADNTNVYIAENAGISRIDKNTGTKKQIIPNDSIWKSINGFAVYNDSLYLLDKSQNQIIKFVPAEAGFGKANYFPDTHPNLISATSLAIDGSVYILFSDGNSQKFTKAKQDAFSLTGLDKPLQNPTQLFTNVDSQNIYVLDNGNSRIVVTAKNGSYQKAYVAKELKNATALDVSEKDKALYFLSQGKIYQISL